MSESKQTPGPQPPPKAEIAPWRQALEQSRSKFLAISDKKEALIELGFASQIIESSDKLKACTPESIINAVINVARTGITLNPVMKLAYLIPRKGKCTLHFDYKGLVKILKDNDALKDISAHIVYSDEQFEESNSPIVAPLHKKKHPKSEADQLKREYLGVYCCVLLPDNTVIYTPFTPYWEILKAEKMSPSAKFPDSAWNREGGWREDMIKKTKIRKDFNLLVSGRPNDKLSAAVEVETGSEEMPLSQAPAPNPLSTKVIFGEIPAIPFIDSSESVAESVADSHKQMVEPPLDNIPEWERADHPDNIPDKVKRLKELQEKEKQAKADGILPL